MIFTIPGLPAISTTGCIVSVVVCGKDSKQIPPTGRHGNKFYESPVV
jgi:hypothetical protein